MTFEEGKYIWEDREDQNDGMIITIGKNVEKPNNKLRK